MRRQIGWFIGFYPQRLRKGIFVSIKAHVLAQTYFYRPGRPACSSGGTMMTRVDNRLVYIPNQALSWDNA